MKKLFFTSAFLLSLFVVNIQAQDIKSPLANQAETSLLADNQVDEIQTYDEQKNATFVKVNLTSLPFKNYSFQLERTLNKTIALSMAYRIMPEGSIPFQTEVIKSIGDDDPDTKQMIEDLIVANYAFTPEIRFYVGKKGYGQGFYFSTFFRHAQFDVSDVLINFDVDGEQESIALSGNVKANTGGIMMGAQWAIGKHFCIDWWILGAHYGKALGNVTGVTSPGLTLSPDAQNSLRDELNKIEIPLSTTSIEVTENAASLTIDGPWAGLRGGLSIGFKF